MEARQIQDVAGLSAQLLSNVMESVVDVRDMSSRKTLNANLQPTNINNLLNAVVNIESLRPRAAKTTLTLHVDQNVPQLVLLDAARVMQVTLNLVDNAGKCARPSSLCLCFCFHYITLQWGCKQKE